MNNTVKTLPDSFGRQWVYVTGAEALAHPQGRPGILIYLIVLWFMGAGVLELTSPHLGIVGFGFALLSILVGVGLVLRNRVAYLLALFLPWRHFLGLIPVLRLVEIAPDYSAYSFVLAFINAGIGFLVAFYLFEGDRPNLIYRNRYRSYRAEAEAENHDR